MSMSGKEAIAGIRVLVGVAKADGVVHDGEKQALAAALEGAPLPYGRTLDTLLAEDVDLDAQLETLVTPEAKQHVFESAYAVAYADGTCSPEEQKTLDRIQAALGIGKDHAALLQRAFTGARGAVLPTKTTAVTDATRRAAQVRTETLGTAVLAAVLCNCSVPTPAIATELATVALQAKLVREIAQTHGQSIDTAQATALLHRLGLGTPAWLAAANLSRLIPGWAGSFDASSSFASTFAVGTLVDSLCAAGELAAVAQGRWPADLQPRYEAAEREGRLAYAESDGPIAAKQDASSAALGKLAEALGGGQIDQATYERKAAELA